MSRYRRSCAGAGPWRAVSIRGLGELNMNWSINTMSLSSTPSHQGYSLPHPPVQRANKDEDIVTPDGARFIGNFHKTLPMNDFGEVDPAAYEAFRSALNAPAVAAEEQVDSLPVG